MRSKTSLINGTILKKDITRFWPLWVIHMIYLLMVGPLATGIQIASYSIEQNQEILSSMGYSGDFGRLIGMAFINYISSPLLIGHVMVVSIIAAILVFGYLNNRTQAYMLHSMPVSRQTMFASHAIAGGLMVIVPYAVMIAILMIMSGVVHAGMGIAVFSFGLKFLLMAIFFYALSCLVVMLSGHGFMSIIIYSVLNCLVISVWYMFSNLASLFQLGGSFLSWDAYGLLRICTPAAYYYSYLGVSIYEKAYDYTAFHGGEIGMMSIYLIPAIVFIVLAVILYQKRPLETVGDNLAFPWSRVIFKLVFTVAGSLFAMQIWGLFFGELIKKMPYHNLQIAMLVIGLILCCFILYFIADMILKKTFMIWKKISWIPIIVTTVLMVAVFFAAKISYDKASIPDVNRVEYVKIYVYNNEYIYEEKEIISEINEIHDKLRGMMKDQNDYDDKWLEDDVLLRFEYALENGNRIERYYYVNPQQYAAVFDDYAALLNHQDMVIKGYGFDHPEQNMINHGNVFQKDSGYFFYQVWQCELMYEALLQDIEEGHIKS